MPRRCHMFNNSYLIPFALACCIGCEQQSSIDMKSSTVEGKLDIVLRCEDTSDLEEYFASRSLGGEMKIHVKAGLAFVHTFPYSGVPVPVIYTSTRETRRNSGSCASIDFLHKATLNCGCRVMMRSRYGPIRASTDQCGLSSNVRNGGRPTLGRVPCPPHSIRPLHRRCFIP